MVKVKVNAFWIIYASMISYDDSVNVFVTVTGVGPERMRTTDWFWEDVHSV